MSEAWNLSISPETVCCIIVKAREFDVKNAASELDPGSNATDDKMVSVLEDQPDDPVDTELRSVIWALNEDEQVDLVTHAWLGRGDGSQEDWSELRGQAADAHNDRTASYLLGMPLLPDYLEEALSQFGESCQEYETGRL